MTQKITDEKMETMIAKAKEFTNKHDYFGGLKLTEYFYLTQDPTGKDALWDAIMAAYDIGFRRGYNRAIKERKPSSKH